jgi:hypothetical protein
MAVNMSKITVPGSGDNCWTVQPDNDANDSDNINYALEHAAVIANTTGPRASVRLMEGTFHCKKRLAVADFKGELKGEGKNETCVIAGGSDGSYMDLLTSAEDLQYLNAEGLPSLLAFYGKKTGTGSSVRITNMSLRTVPFSLTGRPSGFKYRNLSSTGINVAGLVDARGVDGHFKCICSTSLTALGSGVMELKTDTDFFVPGDLYKDVALSSADAAGSNSYNPAMAVNNGVFAITSVVDARTIRFTNMAGVTQAPSRDFESVGSLSTVTLVPIVIVRDRGEDNNPVGRLDLEMTNVSMVGYDGIDPSNTSSTRAYTVVWNCVNVGISFNYSVQLPSEYVSDTGFYHSNVNGKKFFYGATPAPYNGKINIHNCTFDHCGGVNPGGVNMSKPALLNSTLPASPAPSQVIVRDNTIVGLSGGWFGLGVLCFGADNLLDVSGNKIEYINERNVGNDIAAIGVWAHSVGIFQDLTSFFDGAFNLGTDAQRTLSGYNVRIEDNVISMPRDADFPGTAQVLCHIMLSGDGGSWGIFEAWFVGDIGAPPYALNSSMVIRNNICIGDSYGAIAIARQDNGVIKNNTIESSDANSDLLITNCTHITMQHNKFKEKINGHHIVLRGSRNCSCEDNISEHSSTKVLDLSTNTDTNNVIVSADANDLRVIPEVNAMRDKLKKKGPKERAQDGTRLFLRHD